MPVERLTPGIHQIGKDRTVTVRPILPKIGSFGEVDEHEAIHGVLARVGNGTPVIFITVEANPEAGYSGLTMLAWRDPVAAMGPHIAGSRGTWADVRNAGSASGSAGAVAAELYSNEHNRLRIAVVASLLHAKTTISGAQVDQAIYSVDNPDAEIIDNGPDGELRFLVSKIRDVNGYFVSIDEPKDKQLQNENPNKWPEYKVSELDVPLLDHPLKHTINGAEPQSDRLIAATR